ncbi:helix-turn-helix transcriptional regulator [Flavobacterium sp. ACN6]|uniref:helix-turn-helix transcriptional regulator n=1 Tax=Flavobacterium sp. ACN6 TaxID=1920426 RepID=UPI00155508CF|nr:helix-turn-helix transcriptional regulator [Flavobacterium sp. ACN6]PBJ06633.1 helix-turn-helix protein [Flavobacterium sp. ACN6]
MNITIGNRLKKLRLSKNWSQEQVADYLHISQSTYARMERGEGSSWANYIKKICDLYNIIPEQLFKEEDALVVDETSQDIEELFDDRLKELKKIAKYLKQRRDNK